MNLDIFNQCANTDPNQVCDPPTLLYVVGLVVVGFVLHRIINEVLYRRFKKIKE